MSKNSLKILPISHFDSNVDMDFKSVEFDHFGTGQIKFTETAKHAIRLIAEYHDLGRSDEVFIVTTSNSPFVSSCVASTLFNYCKISRVLTDKTKMIFVIHEFGEPYPDITSLYKIAKLRKIPLVEDVAHSMTSRVNGKLLGDYADYVIHSLPKSLPMKNGGLLIQKSSDRMIDIGDNEVVKQNYYEYKNLLPWVHYQRNYQYNFYRNHLKYDMVFKKINGVTPFSYSFLAPEKSAKLIYEISNDSGIELLRTYNQNWISIPLNPWFSIENLMKITNFLKKFLN